MYPDWAKFVEEGVKPISMLYIIIFAMLIISIGIQFYRDKIQIEKERERERVLLNKKLGTKTTKWLLEEKE